LVRRRWQVAACLGIYILASVVMGREVLAHLGDSIANDAGDPILTTTILHWVATHLPYTDAWYQFPIFYPSRDTLTFSEHLLGVSVVAAPIEWVTGSPVIAYNLTLIASFALSAAAMFAFGQTPRFPAAMLATCVPCDSGSRCDWRSISVAGTRAVFAPLMAAFMCACVNSEP